MEIWPKHSPQDHIIEYQHARSLQKFGHMKRFWSFSSPLHPSSFIYTFIYKRYIVLTESMVGLETCTIREIWVTLCLRRSRFWEWFRPFRRFVLSVAFRCGDFLHAFSEGRQGLFTDCHSMKFSTCSLSSLLFPLSYLVSSLSQQRWVRKRLYV